MEEFESGSDLDEMLDCELLRPAVILTKPKRAARPSSVSTSGQGLSLSSSSSAPLIVRPRGSAAAEIDGGPSAKPAAKPRFFYESQSAIYE